MPPRELTALRHLRVITNYLLSAQDDDLHNYIELCVSLLHSCPVLEDAFSQSITSPSNEASALLHRYKTRLSALLQSRTPQARWVAVCMVKASIETSSSMLQYAGTWVPMMVKLLTRPEPEVTVERALVTLTRIFTLTASRPTLTRGLTTPHLPSYLTSVFTLAPSTSTHLLTILHSFNALLKTHPVTCRPFAQRMHGLVRSIIFQDSEIKLTYDKETKSLARSVFVNLHLCAAPKAQADEWSGAFVAIIDETERLCDELFPPIIEDPYRGQGKGKEAGPSRPNVHAGIRRLEAYLQLLCSFLCNQSPSTPCSTLPLPALLHLFTRLFSFTTESHSAVTARNEDYQLLMAYIGEIHVNTLAIVDTMLRRLSQEHASSLIVRLLNEMAFIFNTGGKDDAQTRVAIYKTLKTIIESSGTAFSLKQARPITDIVSYACDELMPVLQTKEMTSGSNAHPMMLITQPTSTKKRKANSNIAYANADSFLSGEASLTSPTFTLYPGLIEAASEVVTTVLQKVPSSLIRSELRSKMERTTILTKNVEGVLAAVLYPSAAVKRGSSLLPHLVGLMDSESVGSSVKLGIEGVVWPRMQAIKYDALNDIDESEDEDRDTENIEMFPAPPPEPSSPPPPPQQQQQQQQQHSRSPTPKEGSALSSPSSSSPYPSPPPAPVPKHATLPPRAQESPSVSSPPAPPPQKGPPSLLTIPSPNPNKIAQPLPPSPLRQSMSMFDEDEDDADDRMKKKMKMTVTDLMEKAKGSPERTGSPENRDVQKVKIIEGRERGEGEGKPIPMPALKLQSEDDDKQGEDKRENGDDDDDMEIPEIVMGEDSDSD